MNRRLLTVLLLAFVIAGGCALLVYRVVGNRMVAAKPMATNKVVAASTNLQIGTVISAADLTTVAFAGTPPKDAILNPKDAIGRGVISAIYQGEPIVDNRLAPKGSGGGLAATIPQGMRACAVRVDEVVGVAGFVTPGMRVDVLVSGNPPGENPAQGTVTKTILQNIQVLSAGTDIQKDAEGKPKQVQVVNLLVTPEQAQELSLAANQYKIQLVLRNPLDTKIAEVRSTATGALFANAGDPAPMHRGGIRRIAARPKPYAIVISNGTSITTEKFPTLEAKQ
ncbi:MAG: Flp pilus assembly protein CpaB [Acidobacteriota bacterium]